MKMYMWDVYYEAADSDDEARWIGTIRADTESDALDRAAQYFEYPQHDLVVKRA